MLIDLYLVDEWKNNKFGGCIYGIYILVLCLVNMGRLWKKQGKNGAMLCYSSIMKRKKEKKNQQNVQWNIALYNEQILKERRKWLEFCEVEG